MTNENTLGAGWESEQQRDFERGAAEASAAVLMAQGEIVDIIEHPDKGEFYVFQLFQRGREKRKPAKA